MRDLAYPLRALVNRMGMQIPAQWVRDKLQIPAPKEEGKRCWSSSTSRQGAGEAAPDGAGIGGAGGQAPCPGVITTTPSLPACKRRLPPLLAGMTDAVQALVMQATTLEEIRDGLLALEPNLSHDELGALLAQAIAASELLGMLEMEEGN